jgi:hypothetical protein
LTHVFAYIRENLVGAFEVMLGRAEGLEKLDTSLEGFWRSFAAFVLVLPFALVALASEQRLAALSTEAAPMRLSLPLEAAVLLVDWITFPIVFALVARWLGLGPRYVPFIVTRNWATVVVMAMLSVVHALHLGGVLPGRATLALLLALTIVALRFSYVITRITLDVPLRTALPIVAFDFLLSVTIRLLLVPGS